MRRAVPLSVAVLLSATVSVGVAQAAECLMNVVVYDSGDSGLRGQLRNAIVDVCDGGNILLRPGIVITLQQGELVIPSGKILTITNPSQAQSTTIDAHGASRVIWVQASANVTLKNVIVRAGAPAGIQNDGSLTISGGQVTANTGFGLVNLGGAARLIDDAVIAANQGAGVLNGPDPNFLAAGQLTLEDESSIKGNVGTTGGGIFNGGLVVLNDGSSIAGNEAQEGGGVYNAFGCCTGTLVLNDSSRITDNFAPFGAGVGGRGAVTLNDHSTVAANRGAGISIVRGEVVLNDNSSIADNDGVGVGVFAVGIILNDESSIVGNAGGGVANLAAFVILNGSSHISENEGGGILSSFGEVFLNGSSSIFANTSQGRGGGISNDSGSVVLNQDTSIHGNVATLGGGIYNFGEASSVTLNDASSIVGNVVTDGLGGGIYSEPGSSVTLNDASSITGNIPDNCFPSSDC